jgi:DNA mismatch repair protein MutL
MKDRYGTRLPEGRYPLFALHLELDTDALDVNVHPQKKEVRIREESDVKEKIRRAIFQSLEGREPPFILQREEVPFLFSDLPAIHERELPFKFAEVLRKAV